MSEDLKARVLELAAIAKECPDNLQERCFELLLTDFLARKAPAKPPKPPSDDETPEPPKDDEDPADETTDQQDLKVSDLHMKARKFLQRFTLTIDDINALFFKEGAEVKPLYEDLKTTRMAEGQIRITLLHALTNGMKTGEFEADVEAVRAECNARKCYDSTNFSGNFKKNASLFDGEYEKGTPLRLSEAGKTELAEVVRELAK